MGSVPWQVNTLGVLDLSNCEVIEAFRLLVGLCIDWGRFFGLRCTAFTSMFTAISMLMLVYLLIIIEYDPASVTHSQLLMTLSPPFLVGLLIIVLALIGEE